MKTQFIYPIFIIIILSCFQIYANETISITNTIYVDDDNIKGPWDGTIDYPFLFIQDGINAANSRDTVSVFSGLYNENIKINKSLYLTGENRDNTIINGGKNGNTITVFSENVNISNFTITMDKTEKINISNWFFAGVRFEEGNNTIYNNIIKHNNLGVFGKQVTNITIINNEFFEDGINFYPYDTEVYRPSILKKHYVHNIKNNQVNGKPLMYYLDKDNFQVPSNVGQIFAVNCKNMTIKDVIINNTDFMIMMYFCIDCRIENSTIFDNDGALCLLRSDYNLIKSNRLKNNFHGLLLDYQSKNNLIQSNEIKNNKNCGVILEYHSRNNFIFNNNFMQNKTLKFYNSYSIDSFLNIFDSNYWDDWVGFGPKIIFGRTTFFPTISLPIALDLRPKEKPYKFI